MESTVINLTLGELTGSLGHAVNFPRVKIIHVIVWPAASTEVQEEMDEVQLPPGLV